MSQLDDRVIAALHGLAGDGSGPVLDMPALRTGRRRRRLLRAVVAGAACVVAVAVVGGIAAVRGTSSHGTVVPITPTPHPHATSLGLSVQPLPGAPGQIGWANATAGLAVGPTGTIYVWDLDAVAHQFRIRAITPTGHLLSTTDAPSAGLDAGSVVGAIDGLGNLYVGTGTAIRRISLDGQMSTLAGGPAPGTVDGSGNSARFNGIFNMAVAPSGDLYLTGGGLVRTVTPEGRVDTLTACASPPPGPGDCLGWPFTIAVGPTGTIFIGSDDYRIRSITPDGNVTQVAVGDLGGAGLFHRMPSLAVDPLDSSLVVHDELGWHQVFPDGTIRAAPDALVGLTSIAVGKDGTVYSIDRGAIVQLKGGG
jgi:hypothetical protein